MNKVRYKVLEIKHSGRKGPRDSPVSQDKYKGLIGSVIESINILDLYEFDIWHWSFVNTESPYEDWYTSQVISVTKEHDKPVYHIETLNTIYVVEELKDDEH